MAHQAHVIWRRETQSGFKAESCTGPVDKRAPAVLKRTPDPLSDSSTNLFLYQTWTFDIKTASREPIRTRINLQHQVGKIIHFLV